MQPRKPPRKCVWCRGEIPEGVPFERSRDRFLHIPCSNELELLTHIPIPKEREHEDKDTEVEACP